MAVVSGYNHILSGALTVDVPASGLQYIKVDGRFHGVVMGTKLLASGGQYQVSVALEDFNRVVVSGYQDTEIAWTDYQNPHSSSIATVTSGLYWKILNPAPNIIKLYNNSTGGQQVRFNFRGIH
jgi:hypothetical protein